MLRIYYPSSTNRYVIDTSKPILLKTCCSAGVNRSATVREFLKNHIHRDSVIVPQYGAYYGDFDMNPITNFETNNLDGFVELFGVRKSPSIQSIIFKELGYEKVPDFTPQFLDMDNENHVTKYKEMIGKLLWNIDTTTTTTMPNIFVIINEDTSVIRTVITRLTEANRDCDLVVIKERDTIYEPENGIAKQSFDAYKIFVDKIESYFEFKN